MQTAVISGPRWACGHGAVCRTRASTISRRVRQVANARCPHGKSISQPANYMRSTCAGNSRRLGQQQSRLQASQQSAAIPAANSPPPLTTGLRQCLLPACKILAVLLCMPLVLEAFAQGSQQWCLLAMAGVLLPLQSKHSRQSMKRWQHIMQAAATEVEAETEEQPPDEDAEEPSDNTILETGAELGNVQTPASVWLPYSTGQNGKVLLSFKLSASSSHLSALYLTDNNCKDSCPPAFIWPCYSF